MRRQKRKVFNSLCEKLILFPHGQYINENAVYLSVTRCSLLRDRSWHYEKFAKCNSDFRKKLRVAATLLGVSAMWHWHCGVDVLSRTRGWVTGLVCSEHCTASTYSGRVHSLPWGVLTRLFQNYFRISCSFCKRHFWRCLFCQFGHNFTILIKQAVKR